MWKFVTVLALNSRLVVASPEPLTALKAMQALPAGQIKKLAVIVGRDGNPEPEQWHFLMHDSASENELRESVVEGRQVVANRGISQFAERLTAGDVMAAESLRIDSDRARKVARNLAVANRVLVARFDYELRRSAPGAAPVWTITCRDESGEKVGAVTLLAGDGRLLAKEGFVRPTVPSVVADKTNADATTTPEPSGDNARTNPASDRRRKVGDSSRPAEVEPAPVAEKKRNPIQRIRRGIHGLFGGSD